MTIVSEPPRTALRESRETPSRWHTGCHRLRKPPAITDATSAHGDDGHSTEIYSIARNNGQNPGFHTVGDGP